MLSAKLDEVPKKYKKWNKNKSLRFILSLP